jgi:hypothetical protein
MLCSPETTASAGLAGLVAGFGVGLLGGITFTMGVDSGLVLSVSHADKVAIHSKIHDSFNGLTSKVCL